MDYLGMENLLVDILKSDLSDELKIKHSKEAIDAFTRRGHFNHTEYPL